MTTLTVSPEEIASITDIMLKTLLKDQGNYTSYYLTFPVVRDHLTQNKLPEIALSKECLPTRGRRTDRSCTTHHNAKRMTILFPVKLSEEITAQHTIETAIPVETMILIDSVINVFIEDKFISEKKNGMQLQREIMDLMTRIYRHAIYGQIKLITSVKDFKCDTKNFPRTQTEGVIYYSLYGVARMHEQLRLKGLI